MASAIGALTTSCVCTVALRPSRSATLSASADVPACVGEPVSAPVAASSETPAGSEPEASDHVCGATPPANAGRSASATPCSACLVVWIEAVTPSRTAIVNVFCAAPPPDWTRTVKV